MLEIFCFCLFERGRCAFIIFTIHEMERDQRTLRSWGFRDCVVYENSSAAGGQSYRRYPQDLFSWWLYFLAVRVSRVYSHHLTIHERMQPSYIPGRERKFRCLRTLPSPPASFRPALVADRTSGQSGICSFCTTLWVKDRKYVLLHPCCQESSQKSQEEVIHNHGDMRSGLLDVLVGCLQSSERKRRWKMI